MDVELIEFGAEDDHVHIMLNVPPKIAISNLVAKLKGKSSYFLRREFAKQLQKNYGGIIYGLPVIVLYQLVVHLSML